MSELIVEVCEVAEVKNHPNADRLDIVTVKGWQVITQRDTYKVGDKVVYFPPDTMLPPERIVEFGIEKYVRSAIWGEKREQCKISATRLRGEPSFGFVTAAPEGYNVGDDMIHYYGAIKYEPPVDYHVARDNVRNPYNFPKYDGPDHWREFRAAFQPNEMVCITEKIHGRNCRAGLIHQGDGVFEFMGGSNNCNKKEFADEGDENGRSVYWEGINDQTKALLQALSNGQNDVVIYGEVYGQGMQDLGYDTKRTFRAFDIAINNKYIDFDQFISLTTAYGVPVVPVLYVGPYSDEVVLKNTDGQSTIAKHLREGVVVKPLVERTFKKRGGDNRLILKSVSADYLNRRGEQTEFH